MSVSRFASRFTARLLAAAVVLALAVVGLPARAQASDDYYDPERTWYVCNGDQVPMRQWGSFSAPVVGYLPARSQVWGQSFGPRQFVVIRDGVHKDKYLPTANGCTTASTAAGRQWMSRGVKYVERAVALDNGARRPDFYSRLAQAIAQSSPQGWLDPQARQYLDRALSTQHPDGGFGIGYEWDAFADGTVNPAGTGYTVTIVTHLGDAVLAAYPHGLVDASVVQAMVDKVESIPSTPKQPDCIAYSDNPNDHLGGYCTHNVNAAAAVFLLQASSLGFDVDEVRAVRMLMHEVAALRSDKTWLYMTGRTKPNDPDHGAYQLKSVSQILPELTQPIINDQMSRPLGVRSAEAHTVLAQLACQDSLRWLPEHDASAAGFWNNADRMAYYAMEATDAGKACQ